MIQTVKVTNRSDSYLGYNIPELNNLYRRFTPNETKDISKDELLRLSWVPGGTELIAEYLIISDENFVKELLNHIEPEYFYTRDEGL